jgi:hypothetical protein
MDASHYLPRLEICVGTKRLLALLDSGASHNFIRAEHILTTGPVARIKVNLADTQQGTEAIGPINVRCHINGDQTIVEFLAVPNLREDIILGCSWLYAVEATIDWQRSCVHYGTRRRKTIYFARERRFDRRTNEQLRFNHGFPKQLASQFEELVTEYADVLSGECAAAVARGIEHRIQLREDKPFRIRPYPCSEEKKRLIYEQVEQMLADGVIERSNSEYCSPVVIVNRKNGKPRFCTDFRRLNALTKDEAAPLPNIREALLEFGPARVFSTLDLRSGYWQIPLEASSRPLTAFATHDGATYQYRVMAFGLKNAPATFQKLMARVLTGFLGKFAAVYLDDIIVYSRTYQEHILHLRQVMERLREANLICAPDKCVIARTRLEYLGHVIDLDTNEPQTRHLGAIQSTPEPTSKKQLKSFLGLCNWLRDYVPHMATLIAPLTDLLSAKRAWKWTTLCQEAFNTLKDAISRPLKLHRPLPNLKYVLQTDASKFGVGAVLYQETDDGSRRIISYASARFSPAEQRYHANEQECLAVIWGIKKFCRYLEDKPFILRTDSRALLWLDRIKDTRSKLTRWSLLLQEYSFTVEHCAGANNELPDYLSRNPVGSSVGDSPNDIERMLPPNLQQIEVETLADEVKQAQATDPDLQNCISRWKRIVREGPREPGERVMTELYVVEGDVMYRRRDGRLLLVVPIPMQRRVLYEYHDSPYAGHPGGDETQRAIEERFTWPDIPKSVRNYVRECLICACAKRGPHQQAAPLLPHVPTAPFQTISVDYMGPYDETPSGSKYILVVEDMFTRWVEAFPLKHTSTAETIGLLEEEVFNRYGYPKVILSDCGTQFRSQRWLNACRRWKAKPWTTAVYHPRANPVERRNQEIKKGLRAFAVERPGRPWDQHLKMVLFNLRTRRNAATGKTPSELLFGQNITRPGEWAAQNDRTFQDLPQRTEETLDHQRSYRRRYDRRPRRTPVEYRAGERVLTRSRQRGINPRWTGPHTLLMAAGGHCYWVDQNGTPTKLHVDDIRKAPAAREPVNVAESEVQC